MNKILLPFTGNEFPEGALEFARSLNELTPVLLAGLFLPEIYYPGDFGFAAVGSPMVPALVPYPADGFDDETEKHVKRFREFCVKHGIEHRVHATVSGFVLSQLEKETRFADMVIIGSKTFYQDELSNGAEVSGYLPVFLRKSESPVLVVPEQFTFPENIVLAYDGGKSSVFAMRQFAYLLPGLASKSTLLVYATNDPAENIPDLDSIEELAARHFSDLTIFKLEADARKYFETMMLDKKSPLLVTGAYERSGFASLFRRSFASDLINDFEFPVFVAHC